MRTEDKHAAVGIRAHVHQLDKLRTLSRTTVSYSGVREFSINPDAAPGRKRVVRSGQSLGSQSLLRLAYACIAFTRVMPLRVRSW